MSIRMVGFDADDTLWKSQDYFDEAQAEFESIMGKYIDLNSTAAQSHLLSVERENVSVYGYGAKGMTLSMMQAAVEMTNETVSASDIRRILELCRGLLQHPVELLEGIEDAVAQVARDLPVVMITKGDLFHQEAKVASTPLSRQFQRIEIVSEKDGPTYSRLLREFEVASHEFLMIGNSMKSDILPVVSLGGWGIHVPYHTTWALENAELPQDSDVAQRIALADGAHDIPGKVQMLCDRAG